MHSKLTKFLSAPNTKYWTKTLSKFLSAQLVIQALMALSGIIIIRTLSKEEYAYFTIANSLQSAMNLLSNSGIMIGLFSIGGRIWQDRDEMGKLIATVLKLRFFLALIIFPVITLILAWLLVNRGASINYTILIVVAILVELYFYFYVYIFQSTLKLNSLFNKIQQQEIIVQSTRLMLVVLAYASTLNVLIATWISTISSGINFWLLKKSSQRFFNCQVKSSKKYNVELFNLFRWRLPQDLFYIFQGQISIWIISIFGDTASIADVGALSRLAVLFSPFSAVVANIVTPNFARTNSLLDLRKKYIKLSAISLFLIFVFLVLICFYPKVFLWLLGSKYQNLTEVVFIFAISVCIGIINSVFLSVNIARGWVRESWVSIPITLITQVFLIFLIDMSQLQGVILFSLFSQIPETSVNLFMNLKGLFSFDTKT